MNFFRIDPYTIVINDPRVYVMDIVDEECTALCKEITEAAKKAEEEAQDE